MATFEFAKDAADIEEPELIDQDWYVCVITKVPEIKPNAKKKDGASYEDGAGDNLVFSLRIISDDEIANGRAFTMWIPYPSAEDMETRDGRGQLKYDAKMARLIEIAEKGAGCSADGDTIDILPNARIGLYVNQSVNNRNNEIENSIDWFQGFKSPDDIGLPEGFDEENSTELPDDDMPF